MYYCPGREPVVTERARRRTRRWALAIAWGLNDSWAFGWLYRGPAPQLKRYEYWAMVGPLAICVSIMDPRPGDRLILEWLADRTWGIEKCPQIKGDEND